PPAPRSAAAPAPPAPGNGRRSPARPYDRCQKSAPGGVLYGEHHPLGDELAQTDRGRGGDADAERSLRRALSPPLLGAGRADPARTVARVEEQAAVRAALASLPERQRDCLILRHSGHSYAEIAAALGIAVGSVGVILARGERAFRETYQERSHDLS